MKKILSFLLFSLAVIVHWFDKLGDLIDQFFDNEERVSELEEKVANLEKKQH